MLESIYNGYLKFFILVFSSRRRHTRWNCDWSSDVCSSRSFLSFSTATIFFAPALCSSIVSLPSPAPISSTLFPSTSVSRASILSTCASSRKHCPSFLSFALIKFAAASKRHEHIGMNIGVAGGSLPSVSKRHWTKRLKALHRTYLCPHGPFQPHPLPLVPSFSLERAGIVYVSDCALSASGDFPRPFYQARKFIGGQNFLRTQLGRLVAPPPLR